MTVYAPLGIPWTRRSLWNVTRARSRVTWKILGGGAAVTAVRLVYGEPRWTEANIVIRSLNENNIDLAV